MRYEIVFSAEAVADLQRLRAVERAAVRDAVEQHLRHEPTATSKSRIKRLRGRARPQFRLRVGDVRVFYDVSEGSVEVLAILSKADAEGWLTEVGEPDEASSTNGNKE